MSHNPPPLGFHPVDPCLSNWMFNAGNAVFFLSLSLDLHYFLFGLQSNSQRVFEPSWVSQRGPKQAHSGSLCWCLVGKGARGAPQASPRGSWSPAEPNYAKWQGTCPSSAGFAGDKAPAAARWGPCCHPAGWGWVLWWAPAIRRHRELAPAQPVQKCFRSPSGMIQPSRLGSWAKSCWGWDLQYETLRAGNAGFKQKTLCHLLALWYRDST